MSLNQIIDKQPLSPLVVDDSLKLKCEQLRVATSIVSASQTLTGNLSVGGALAVTGAITGASIQFPGPSQSALSHYYSDASDYVIPFSNGTQTGQLTLRFTRVGDIMHCEARGFADYPTAAIPATSPIPLLYRPTHLASIMIPFYASGSSTPGWVGLLTLATSGVITIVAALSAGVAINAGFTYNTGTQTGPANYDRFNFSYKL